MVAGSPRQRNCTDGPTAESRLDSPSDLCLLPGGGERLVVADTGNFCIRLVDVTAGTVSTLAGVCGGQGRADGPGPEARFGGVRSLQCLANCSVLAGDAGTKTLRWGQRARACSFPAACAPATSGRAAGLLLIDLHGPPRRPCRLITLDGDTCTAQPPGTRRRLTLLAAMLLVGGAAMLCILLLGLQRWANSRAAMAEAHMRAVRVEAAEADLAQVRASAAAGACPCAAACSLQPVCS